jgi:hypothetical protein
MFHAGQPMSTDRLVEELWSVSGPDDAARRPAVLDDALALWRGPPLAEFAGSARVDQATTRLEALHVHSRQSRDDIRSEMEARRLLVDEAGIEPSPELVDLEHRVLAHDPTLVATADPRGNW